MSQMKRRKNEMLKRALLLAAAGCLAVPEVSAAADAASFRTEEYKNSVGLDLIHAADAYALGYTGSGITAGIVDSPVNLKHNEFSSKTSSKYLSGSAEDIDWKNLYHGTAVAGILAASKNDIGMHGVAFDANILSVYDAGLSRVLEDKEALAAYRQALIDMADGTGVRCFNLSFGYPVSVDEMENWDAVDEYKKALCDEYINSLYYPLRKKDIVYAVAAGNSGSLAGPVLIDWHAFNGREEVSRLINTIAIDSEYFDLESNAASEPIVFESSCMAKYTENQSIAAPGCAMAFPGAVHPAGYMRSSGTSFAAPAAAGAVVLVSQAFPFLNGSQLTDVVLGSANSSFSLPRLTISMHENLVTGPDTPLFTLNVLYFGDKPSNSLEIESDLRSYYQQAGEKLALYSFNTEDAFIEYFTDNMNIYENVPREIVFGQGILDVGAAVRGPKVLNARRSPENYSVTENSAGQREALYNVDTRGYSAEWSSNIAEKRAGKLEADSPQEDLRRIYSFYRACGGTLESGYIARYNQHVEEAGLENLPVGLCKTGDGILTLSGTNTYPGTTLISGGVLAVSKRADGTGGALENSPVVVNAGGTLAGNGAVRTSITSGGTVSPGVLDGSGVGILTAGSYTQQLDGVLSVTTTKSGGHDTLLVQGSASVQGTVQFSPAPDYYPDSWSRTYAEAVFLTVAGTVTGGFAAASAAPVSPTLTWTVVRNGSSHETNTYTLTVSRAPDAYSQYARTELSAAAGRALASAVPTAGSMQSLYEGIDYSASDGSGVRDALGQLSPDPYANAGFALFDVHRMLSDLMLEKGALSSAGDGKPHWLLTSYSGAFRMSENSERAGYKASHAGITGGYERSMPDGLTVGAHFVYNKPQMDGTVNGRMEGHSFYTGAQLLYGPEAWGGLNLYAVARAGSDSLEMKRSVPGSSNTSGMARHIGTCAAWCGL